MENYIIENKDSAHCLGVYFADCELQAYNEMLDDANEDYASEIPEDISIKRVEKMRLSCVRERQMVYSMELNAFWSDEDTDDDWVWVIC